MSGPAPDLSPAVGFISARAFISSRRSLVGNRSGCEGRGHGRRPRRRPRFREFTVAPQIGRCPRNRRDAGEQLARWGALWVGRFGIGLLQLRRFFRCERLLAAPLSAPFSRVAAALATDASSKLRSSIVLRSCSSSSGKRRCAGSARFQSVERNGCLGDASVDDGSLDALDEVFRDLLHATARFGVGGIEGQHRPVVVQGAAVQRLDENAPARRLVEPLRGLSGWTASGSMSGKRCDMIHHIAAAAATKREHNRQPGRPRQRTQFVQGGPAQTAG